jgi:hypothetical protein
VTDGRCEEDATQIILCNSTQSIGVVGERLIEKSTYKINSFEISRFARRRL